MSGIIFSLIILFIFGGGGWLVGKAFGNLLFPEKKYNYTFISNIEHKHTHIHHHDHKSISIIDDETKDKILDLKKSNHKKSH